MNLLKQLIFRQFRKNEIALHELNYLFWECTWRCNLACRHCGSDCVSDGRIDDMPFEDLLKAIAPLEKLYKPYTTLVVITGGEPLLRQDLPSIGKQLYRHGFRWGIVSNGFAYTPQKHQALLEAGMSAITISLDGTENTHNWLRKNPLSYQKAINALQLIVSAPQLNYDVVTCVHPLNIKELALIKEQLISLKVKSWRLFTIAPIGRAKNNPDLQLNSVQKKEMMDFIVQTRQENMIDLKFSCESFTGPYEEKVRDSYFFCRAGINIGSVLIDGSISACPNINRSFVQGNIYKDDLLDVWNNRFAIMRDRQWMKNNQCVTCHYFKVCNGGAMHLRDENNQLIDNCLAKQLL